MQRNEAWKHIIGNRIHQIRFVTAILNTKLVIPWVPKFGERIEKTPHCWTFLVYNSDTEIHYGGIKSLLSSLNEYFYERCGVASGIKLLLKAFKLKLSVQIELFKNNFSSVDLAYPSNFDIFGDLVKETPAILYKHPTALMLDMTELEKSNDVGSFSLYPINEWGKLYSARDLSKLIYIENCLLKFF